MLRRTLARNVESPTRKIGGGGTIVPALPSRPDRSESEDLIVTQADAWDIPAVRSTLLSHEIGQFQPSSLLADYMTRDDRISSCLNTRVLGVQGLPFRIEPAIAKDQKAIAQAQALTEDWGWICPPRVIEELLTWEVLMGFALAEIVWKTEGERWIPTIKVWHPQYIYYRLDLRQFVAITQNGLEYITPGDGRWLLFSRHGHYRCWMRGAIRGLSLPWLARQYAWRDWGRFNEIHGLPIKQAVVPQEASDADKRKFFSQIRSLAANGAILAPQNREGQQFKLELIAAANTGSWQAFQAAMERGDMAIQLQLLGQNLSGGEVSGGSFAAAKVADGVRDDFKIADASLLGAELYAQVVRPWAVYNFGDDTLTPKPVFDASVPRDRESSASTFKTVMEAVQIAVMLGADIDIGDLIDEFSLPILPDSKFTAPPDPSLTAPRKTRPSEAGDTAPGEDGYQLHRGSKPHGNS